MNPCDENHLLGTNEWVSLDKVSCDKTREVAGRMAVLTGGDTVKHPTIGDCGIA